MSLQNMMRDSYFLRMEEILNSYKINYWFYNDDFLKGFEHSALYLAIFNESYRDKIENGNIPELYKNQTESDKEYYGWKIFKINDKNPYWSLTEVLSELDDFHLINNLFDRLNVLIPECDNSDLGIYLTSAYRDALNTKLDKAVSYFSENSLNGDIRHYYDKEQHQNIKDAMKKRGMKTVIRKKDRIINKPFTNNNCIEKEKLIKKYNDVKSFIISYKYFDEFEYNISKFDLEYSRDMPYIFFDNRPAKANGGCGEEIYANFKVFFPVEFEDKVLRAYYLSREPRLRNHLYYDHDFTYENGFYQLYVPYWEISRITILLEKYGIKFLLDPKVQKTTKEGISILIQAKDAPMVQHIIERQIEKIYQNKTYKPIIELHLHPQTESTLEKCKKEIEAGIPKLHG